MGRSRKDLMREHASLQKQIEIHEQKIKENPHSIHVEHWKKEIREFRKQQNAIIQQLNVMPVEKHCPNCKKDVLFNGNKCSKCGLAII